MNHVIAGCGKGVSESCGKYATETWSGGAVILLVVIIAIIVGLFFLKRRGK